MEYTRLPLTHGFLAMPLMSKNKKGISAMELRLHLGVRSPTAWLLKQKLMQAMREPMTSPRCRGRYSLTCLGSLSYTTAPLSVFIQIVAVP
jgi:hypothetical protein